MQTVFRLLCALLPQNEDRADRSAYIEYQLMSIRRAAAAMSCSLLL